ncbi:mitochondrial carrier family [Nannochloropsis oceanica]
MTTPRPPEPPPVSKLPSSSSPSALEALLPHLETGDLVLFNRRCGAMGPVGAVVCQAAKLYGRYDHLGVVVREEKEGGRLMLLDAGFNGVQYVDLKERMRRSKSYDIAVRRLHGVVRTPALRAAMQEYVEEVRGHQYKQSFFQLLASGLVTPAQWRREHLFLEVQRHEERVRGLKRELGRSMALTPLERAALEKALEEARAERLAAVVALEGSEVSIFENKEDSRSGLFCSELAAAAFQRIGLLPHYPASNTYIPTDFATSKPPWALGRAVAALRREGLNLLQGAYLGEEIPVRWEGKEVGMEEEIGAMGIKEEGDVKRGRIRREGEGQGLEPVVLARALKLFGPTSGLVEEGEGEGGGAGRQRDSVPMEVQDLFHTVMYRDGQRIEAFGEGGRLGGREGRRGGRKEGAEGSMTASLYVIASGEVDLYKEWQDEAEEDNEEGGNEGAVTARTQSSHSSPSAPCHHRHRQLLATFGPGTVFGGPSFLPPSLSSSPLPSGSTSLHAKARGKTVRLWRVAGEDLPLLLQGREPPTHPRTAAEKARVLSVLRHHPYFVASREGGGRVGRRRKKEAEEEALRRFFLVRVKKGEVILEQGARGNCFYILDEGQAQINRRKPVLSASSPLPPSTRDEGMDRWRKRRRRRLTSHHNSTDSSPTPPFPSSSSSFLVSTAVGPGAFFGEAAALFNSRRGASVVATEDCRLWAVGRFDFMHLTGRGGSPYLLDFFNRRASIRVPLEEREKEREDGEEEERYMTHADFLSAFFPHSPSHSPAAPRLLLQALDPSRAGLISFSELVHLDVWMNTPSPHVQVALRLSQRETGFERVTLGDWAELRREAARREEEEEEDGEGGKGGKKGEQEEEDAKFVARVFGSGSNEKIRWWRKTGAISRSSSNSNTDDDEAATAAGTMSSSLHSIPYDTFLEALASPDCPRSVRRYLRAIEEEISLLRKGWEEAMMPGIGDRAALRRARTMLTSQQPEQRLQSERRAVIAESTSPHTQKQLRNNDGTLSPSFSSSSPSSSSSSLSPSSPSSSLPNVWPMVLSASVGGALARLVVAPLERAKILIQTTPVPPLRPPLTLREALRLMLDPRYAYSPWGGFLYRHTRGLFVGNGLNMLRISSVLATQVILYQYLRDHALRPAAPAFPFTPSSPKASSSSSSSSSSDPTATTWALTLGGSMAPPSLPPSSPPSPLPLEAKHMLAGGMAGVVANLLLHPLDTLRARITVQKPSLRPYNQGALPALARIWREEGPRALVRGATPCAIWAFLYIGINYTCLAFLAPLTAHHHQQRKQQQQQQQHPPRFLNLASLSSSTHPSSSSTSSAALASVLVAGTVAQAVAYPFDLLRRRMQLGGEGKGVGGSIGNGSSSGSSGTMWSQAKVVVREGGGVRGLYRGFPVLLLKLLPTTVVSYRVSARVAEWLEANG